MVTRAVSPQRAQVPNALTVLRLGLIPVFIAIMATAEGGHSWAGAIVFTAAGVTDQIDGWLARRWHVESDFGRIADPLADRLMIDVAIVALWLHGRLPWPALMVILVRDVILVGGYRLFLQPRGYDVEVNALGKLATWGLYAALALTLATSDGTDWPLWLFWIALGVAVVAGVQYLVEAVRKVGISS
jgi:CDP-diacylglycerol---glycerol-3-phosphate 3-phosphatidyltransferase